MGVLAPEDRFGGRVIGWCCVVRVGGVGFTTEQGADCRTIVEPSLLIAIVDSHR